MEKLRLGIVGLGNQGKNYLKSFSDGNLPEVEITAVADIDETKFERAKSFIPGVKCFKTFSELIQSGLIDAVAIATPHYFHPPMVIEALNNNIHALSEKPAGVYTKQVREAIEVASKSDYTYAMMYNVRTNEIFKKVKEIVSSGIYGKMIRMSWIVTSWFRPQSYYDSGTWRATWAGEGGGVLLNQAPHQLDLWQWICGMPNRISAFCSEGKFHNIEVEDDVTIYAEYPSGATGTFICSTGEFPGSNRLEISMDKANLVCEYDNVLGRLVLKIGELKTSLSEFTMTSENAFGKPDIEWKTIDVPDTGASHEKVINSFAAHILRGEDLIAEGYEGINGLEISNAVFLSSWLGKPVDLPVDEDLFYDLLQNKIKNSKYKKNVNNNVNVNMKDSYQ